VPPLGYLEFIGLVSEAAGVLTDSGGIQEETTFLGVPCFTLRDNTERPVTVQLGTNMLLGLSPERICEVPELIVAANSRAPRIPPLWDGRAAERLVTVLAASVHATPPRSSA
jgi:UDP-N-acetylglucosamine 2-epimerase (non-hydrolysing)